MDSSRCLGGGLFTEVNGTWERGRQEAAPADPRSSLGSQTPAQEVIDDGAGFLRR